jgi:hypothetical protein
MGRMALRCIPLSRRSHIIGVQPLATGIVEHESALERDFVTLTCLLRPPNRMILEAGALRRSRRSEPRG